LTKKRRKGRPDRRRAGHDVVGMACQIAKRPGGPHVRVDLSRRINLLDTGVRSDHDCGVSVLATDASVQRFGRLRLLETLRAGQFGKA
jgi:hypothetical protein